MKYNYPLKHSPAPVWRVMLFSLITMLAASASASAAGYYIDMLHNDEKITLAGPDQYGFYTTTVSQLNSNFKIFGNRYVPGNSGQNAYIFGAADGQPSGVSPDSYKYLANPGSDMQIEGGGILYGATFAFNPERKILLIVGGSYTQPESTDPAATIDWNGYDISSAAQASVQLYCRYKEPALRPRSEYI